MATLDFWYDFASTYSYLSAMRIREAAREAEVEVRWKPFLLGPIFRSQGWETSPFKLYPAKGRYMVQDITRIAASRDLTFRMPRPFPQNSLYAARIAVIAAAEGWAEPFSLGVFRAEFAEGKNIDDPAVLSDCITAAGRDPQALLPRIAEEGIKNLLKAYTAQAQALGVFGAPSFITSEGELFWGDDRLEEALEQARRDAEKQEEARKAQEQLALEEQARQEEQAKAAGEAEVEVEQAAEGESAQTGEEAAEAPEADVAETSETPENTAKQEEGEPSSEKRGSG